MSIQLTYKVNNRLHVKVEEENQKRAIAKIGFFTELPDTCPRCGEAYGLQHRQSEGYNFFEARCENGHISQLGQHKEGDTLFYKEKQWKTIEERKGHTPKEEPEEKMDQDPVGQGGDDLPF